MPNVLSPMDLVSRPDNMDEAVHSVEQNLTCFSVLLCQSFCLSCLYSQQPQ